MNRGSEPSRPRRSHARCVIRGRLIVVPAPMVDGCLIEANIHMRWISTPTGGTPFRWETWDRLRRPRAFSFPVAPVPSVAGRLSLGSTATGARADLEIESRSCWLSSSFRMDVLLLLSRSGSITVPTLADRLETGSLKPIPTRAGTPAMTPRQEMIPTPLTCGDCPVLRSIREALPVEASSSGHAFSSRMNKPIPPCRSPLALAFRVEDVLPPTPPPIRLPPFGGKD